MSMMRNGLNSEYNLKVFKEKQMRSRKGLTLIELLIVVIILGALAAIAIPRITTSTTDAKRNACTTNIDTLNTAIEMYNIDHSAWPSQLSDVDGNTAYFPDGPPSCPFGTAYQMNSNHRITAHSH
jgi:prepilin-type N-terminal cleavage/methylation domain-containing protein